jgi:uncharacterized membrane protein
VNGGILFEHAMPLWLIGPAVLAAAAWGAWLLLRAGRPDRLSLILAALRFAFLLLLAWCLLRPLRREQRVDLVKPRFVVALDTSGSMGLAPRQGETTRRDVARGVLGLPWVETVSAACVLEAYPFAAEPGQKAPIQALRELPADGASTRLSESLAKLTERYRGQRLGGLLLLSDGLDTRETSAAWTRRAWPCPIYTVRPEPVGTWDVTPDVHVADIQTPRRVTVGWSSDLKALISGEGTGGREISVCLSKNGAPLQKLPTQIAADGGTREVSFRIEHDEAGEYVYSVSVPPLPGEINTNDNAYAAAVLVMEPGNSLLYVEGLPRWESKYLTRALQAIESVRALCFVRGPDGRFLTYGAAAGTALEMTEAQLAGYKIVVLGDLDAAGVGAERAAALRKFVEAGGSLVVLGGPHAWGTNGLPETALADLLGVRGVGGVPLEGKYAPALTPDGRSHAIFSGDAASWTPLPPLLSVYPSRELAAGAVSLATAQTESGALPVLAAQRFGQGKVLAVLTDSLWRWQLDPAAGNAYFRFWNQALQWLLPAETAAAQDQMDLFAESDRCFLGEAVTLNGRASAGGAAVPPGVAVTCEIAAPDGRRVPFAMSREEVQTAAGGAYTRYALSYTAEAPGLHRAVGTFTASGRKVESPAFSFFVSPFTPESNPRPANLEALQALARESGGRFLETGEVSRALSVLRFETGKEETVTYRSLWNTIPLAVCLLGLLCAEWIVRKAANLA